MKKKVIWLGLIILMSFSFSTITGCRTKVEQSGFLTDYPDFEKGPKGGAALVYFKEGVNFNKYHKIMMDEVVFYFSKDSKYKGMIADEIN